MKPFRILVTGDRNWKCHPLAWRIVRQLLARRGAVTIVHGSATGVDSAFHDAAISLGADSEPHPADWTLGRRAGPTRNQAMVDRSADVCLACHRDLARSKGTKDCVRRAIKAGIPVYLIDGDDARPRRILDADNPGQPPLFAQDEVAQP